MPREFVPCPESYLPEGDAEYWELPRSSVVGNCVGPGLSAEPKPWSEVPVAVSDIIGLRDVPGPPNRTGPGSIVTSQLGVGNVLEVAGDVVTVSRSALLQVEGTVGAWATGSAGGNEPHSREIWIILCKLARA